MEDRPESYVLFLNGEPYGRGPKDYMIELMNDYLNCDMYGREEVSFFIRRNPFNEKESLFK